VQDLTPPLTIKFRSMETRNTQSSGKTRIDLMIKVSFKDDFKNVELLQKGIAPLKVNSFNGPTLYIMLTSQIGCEVEVTVVFQELRKQRAKLNKEDGELGHTLNKID
jgi:hypothetical protein